MGGSLATHFELSNMAIPIFIISYNRGSFLLKCIEGLRSLKSEVDIVVHDNGSDDDFTKTILDDLLLSGIKVFYNEKIKNPDELNSVNKTVMKYFEKRKNNFYVVTDCDIDVSTAMPNVLDVFQGLLHIFPRAECVGPMLTIKDIPDNYPLKNRAMNRHIEQFWHKRPSWCSLGSMMIAYQNAPIDTTFALHRPNSHFRRLKSGLRVYEPFEAKHLDWYLSDLENQPYHQTSHPAISHWNNKNELDAHRDEKLFYNSYAIIEKDKNGKLYEKEIFL